MKQIGEMGFLGIAVPENYGGLGNGFRFNNDWLVITFLAQLVHWQLLMERTLELERFLSYVVTELKNKTKNISKFSWN